MTTRSDVPDLAVDELKRRARRRLVGAIVLALAAAVLLPLLLENEPKPLGEDVSIQIPPIDSGKFINPLSSGKALDPKAKGSVGMSKNGAPAVVPPPADAPATVPPATNPKSAENEQRTSGSSATPPAPAAAPPTAAPETKVADAATGATDIKPAPAAPAPKSEPTLDDAKATATAKTDGAKSGAAFVVQIAAFSDRYGARSLVTKLKRGGFPGYTEEVTTDKGTLHRVRVGPYASREAAATALAKLKAAGFNGMIAHVG
ncbi:MAG TPA: SPOR domain-containing protein [Casimicrobiaceae bacterium]|nr:SPOR domain-containing protein [Casimicrobiaceae bacterium]